MKESSSIAIATVTKIKELLPNGAVKDFLWVKDGKLTGIIQGAIDKGREEDAKRIEELTAKLDAGEAAGAEMRNWINSQCWEHSDDCESQSCGCGEFYRLKDALLNSTTLGTGWKSPDEVVAKDALIEKLNADLDNADRIIRDQDRSLGVKDEEIVRLEDRITILANAPETPDSSTWIDKPTEPGWWWYRRKGHGDEMIEIRDLADEGSEPYLNVYAKTFGGLSLNGMLMEKFYEGQFQGPLKPVDAHVPETDFGDIKTKPSGRPSQTISEICGQPPGSFAKHLEAQRAAGGPEAHTMGNPSNNHQISPQSKSAENGAVEGERANKIAEDWAKEGDGAWIVPECAEIMLFLQGEDRFVPSNRVGQNSAPEGEYRLPWPPAQQVEGKGGK